MLKNRFVAALAMAGLVSFAACEAEEEPVVEEPVVEEPVVAPVEPVAPAVAPEAGVAPAEGVAEIPGNGIDDDGDGLIDEAV